MDIYFEIDDIGFCCEIDKRVKKFPRKPLNTFGQNSKRIFKEHFVLQGMINKLKEVYSKNVEKTFSNL